VNNNLNAVISKHVGKMPFLLTERGKLVTDLVRVLIDVFDLK